MADALPRLAMALVVRDEVDFIGANILFHAALGVDSFIVLDNGSRDGTREVLESLKQTVDIEILEDTDPAFPQGAWSTSLAQRLREQGKADYFFCIDADEFLAARQGSLKAALVDKAAVLKVSRWNMMPLASDVSSPEFRFFDAIHRVVRNPGDVVRGSLGRQYAPGMLRRVPSKIVSTLTGLKAIGAGSHQFEHDAGTPVSVSDLRIFHYPWRPFGQFERKVGLARERIGFRRAAGLPVDTRWVRWVDLADRGDLPAEHQTFALLRYDAKRLVAAGVLQLDTTIRRNFRKEASETSGR